MLAQTAWDPVEDGEEDAELGGCGVTAERVGGLVADGMLERRLADLPVAT